MKKMQQAPTTYSTDANGNRLAHVALSGTDQRATLYADDLERVLAEGWSPFWSWSNVGSRYRYVLVCAGAPGSGRRRSMTVARLLAGAGKGRRVEYIDGDRANLRRDNLRIVKGGGCAHTPALAVLPRGAKQTEPNKRASKARHSDRTDAPRKSADHAWNPATTIAPACPAEAHTVPAVTPREYTHHAVDRAALSARVREQLARQRNAGG